MKKFTLMLLMSALSAGVSAQKLTEVTGVRIWEHHSSGINSNAPFGDDANGSMSGYDFVTRAHHQSFDAATFGPLTAAQQANLDMVEHNSLFGNGGNFGFTSGTSSIWGGPIKGNGLTKYYQAPATFNYDTITNVSTIRNLYNTVTPVTSINAVTTGAVYLARIRSTDLYVAIKITSVQNVPASYKSGDLADVYFDFKYKYGTHCAAPNAAYTSAPNGVRTYRFNYTGTTTGIDSVVWNFGDGQKQKVTTSYTAPVNHTFPGNGNYNTCVNVYSSCGSNSFCKRYSLSIGGTGNAGGVKVYPSPATDHVTIEGAAASTAAITDFAGRRLISRSVTSEKQDISISGLPAGMYILTLTNVQGETSNMRFIKQ